MQLYIYSGH